MPELRNNEGKSIPDIPFFHKFREICKFVPGLPGKLIDYFGNQLFNLYLRNSHNSNNDFDAGLPSIDRAGHI